MNRKSGSLRQSINDESGQTLIWSVFLFALMLGIGGLTVDLGHAYICSRELQASTDAAAMAAASQLPITTSNQTTNTVVSTGTQYGSQSGKYNAIANLNTPLAVTGATTTVTPGCVTVSGLAQCSSTLLANAVMVKQTVTIPTMLIRALAVFGLNSAKSITLSATSFAQMRGAQRGPYDVAMLIDTTSSMQNSDGGSNCTGTKVQCAEQGAQILMSEFSPCLPGGACGTATAGNVANPVDELSLFTFPAQTSQLGNDESCPSKTLSEIAYPDSTAYGTVSHSTPTMPPVGTATGDITSTNLQTLVNQYQVVPLSSNYRASDSTTGSTPLTVATGGGTLSSPSIVDAVGGNSYFTGSTGTCNGMQAKGGEGTFYGGAMFVAQEYLANNSRTNAANVMILLSDGDANGGTMSAGSSNLNNSGSSKGSYPSSTSQCQQAIDIATAAKAQGTKIYVVGYGVASGGCSTDGGLTACQALRSIASSDQNFFVDTSSVACPGATSVTMNGRTNSLSAIFTAIVGDLTVPRLLPNNLTTIGWTPM